MRTRVAVLATLLLCLFFPSASAGTDAAAGSGRSCDGQGLRVGAARFRIVHLRAGGPIHVGQAGRGELVRCMLALGGCPESTPPRQPHADCVVEQETRTGAQVPLARLKEIAPRVALGDRPQRRVLYVEGDSCAAAKGDAALLRCLRSPGRRSSRGTRSARCPTAVAGDCEARGKWEGGRCDSEAQASDSPVARPRRPCPAWRLSGAKTRAGD